MTRKKPTPRPFQGKSGVEYLVVKDRRSWDAYTKDCYGEFVPFCSKRAALDCGAIGTMKDHTHALWPQIW